MLKIIRSTRSAANPKKTKRKTSDNNVVGNNMVSDSDASNQTNSTKVKNQEKMTKFKILVKSKNHDFSPNFRNIEVRTGFFTLKARLAFNQ